MALNIATRKPFSGNAAPAAGTGPQRHSLRSSEPPRHESFREQTAANPSAGNELPGFSAKLDEGDVQLLCALAAMQVRYGRPEEAAGYLMALRRRDPGNLQVLRLLAQVLLRMRRHEEADRILDEIDRLGGSAFMPLWRAVVRLRLDRLVEAREWFRRFVTMRG
jgi:predicted Zn-dependent protease